MEYWSDGKAEARQTIIVAKEYPQAGKAKPQDFFDDSFVEELEKSGFF